MARPWLRFYRKTVNNPKVQRLSPELFRAWVNILCTTDDDGRLPAINDMAFTLRVGAEVVHEWLSTLRANGLFDLARNGKVTAHDWSEHNYESDVSTDRVKRFRKRSRNAPRNAPDTESDTELESEQKNTEPSLPAVGSADAKPKKGTRWESSRIVEKQWLLDGYQCRVEHDLPNINLGVEAEKFAHYWSSKTGANATKLDWHRTWLAWCLKAEGKSNGTGFMGRTNGRPSVGDTIRDLAAGMDPEDSLHEQ